MMSKTVVTVRPATVVVGTPRRIVEPAPVGSVNAGRSRWVTPPSYPAESAIDSAGRVSPRSRFHLPSSWSL